MNLIKDRHSIRRVLALLALGAYSKPTLALGSEVAQIQAELQAGPRRYRLHTKIAWAPRVQDLQGHLLRAQPGIVHIATHGEDDGSLAAMAQSGVEVSLPGSALAGLMGNFPEVRLVVLNTCHSAGIAQKIATGGRAAIGMEGRVSDLAAMAFAVAFYRALGFGCTVGRAFDLGCNAIELEGLSETGVPRLFADSEAMALQTG